MRAGGLETDEADARADDAATRRKVPVQARSRERVERVLDTAAQLVDELGPDAVTTASIAAAAGVSIGWLYDFFPNRESVFDAVVERSFEKVTPIAEAVHASMPTADWRETLEAVVWTLFDFYRDEPGFRVLWFSRFQSAAMVARNRQNDLAGVGNTYERMHRRGLDLVGVDPEHAIHLVIGIIDKGLDLAFLLDPEGDRDLIDQTIVAAISYLERYAPAEGPQR
ncbi:MAG TPA: TetR/AcrR family transcriptional regulator [Ilumatobacter sp.]